MFRSEYADVPPVELPIHDAVLARAAEFGDIPALIDGTDGTTLSYEQVDRFHRRVAAALAEAGVGKGDVLALHSPDTIAFPTAFYAATRAGATVTTVHPLATAQEFAKQLTDCPARWIITVSPLLDIARRAAELAGGVREIVVCDSASGHRSLTCWPPPPPSQAATGVGAERPIREGRSPAARGGGRPTSTRASLGAWCTAAKRKPSRRRGYDKALRRSAPERHVVRHPTATDLSEAEIVMYVAERVAPYKRIRHVTFIDGVPRAASGKILRRQLRERA